MTVQVPEVGGAVPVRAFQLQHDIAGAVAFEPFMGDGGAVLGLPRLVPYRAFS